ncbi:conserved membrane hypothetical protein [Desulfovibrionales bacterium]
MFIIFSQLPTDPFGKDTAISTHKRLFIGLTSGICGLTVLTLILLWVVPYIGLRYIHPLAPFLLGTLLSLVGLVAVWAWLGLILSILYGQPAIYSKRLRGLTIKHFLPLMIILARFIGISKEHVMNSFIKVNNELVKTEHHYYPANKILLLMPHCLQNSHCSMRLTYDINNCKCCGKCPITNLLALSKKIGVHLAIATGGTVARRIVVKIQPKLIIAVACERDLTSGIQDAYPIPVYGVLNERPKGPCLDTLVPIARLEEAIDLFSRRVTT